MYKARAFPRPSSFKTILYSLVALFLLTNFTDVSFTRALAPTVVAKTAVTAAVAAVDENFIPADIPSSGDRDLDLIIFRAGQKEGVDPRLLHAVILQESRYKADAESYAGAQGLMQLMPATAARFGVRNIFDPRQNIEAGTRYMRFLLDRFDGDVRLALAGYNAGEGAVDRYGRRVPPYRETQEYVRRISERYSLMRDPESARRAPVVNRAQATAANQAAQPAPALYETNVYSVRLPDGKLMLVSQ